MPAGPGPRPFATVADSLDIPGYAVKALLNHKGGSDVTADYIVASVERLREPMQKITDYVLRCAGVKVSAEVLPFERADRLREEGRTEAMTPEGGRRHRRKGGRGG